MLRVITLLCALLTVSTADAALRWQDAETWVAQELAPELTRQFRDHPRFRGQNVRVVAFENGVPAARTNVLALTLRDQLSAALLRVPGIQLAAPAGMNPTFDCSRSDIDYYVGLEIAEQGQSGVRLVLRTLDARTNTWVTGHDRRWQGNLTAAQQRALRTRSTDPQFRGQRATPFSDGEFDVLARALARELACASVKQLGGVYVVRIAKGDVQPQANVGQLIGNNLASLVAMQFTEDSTRANAVLGTSLHTVDGNLAQVWVSLTPVAGDSALPLLTASAYVRLRTVVAEPAPQTAAPPPDAPAATPVVVTRRAPPPIAIPVVATKRGTLGTVQLVRGRGRSSCGIRRPCTALEIRSQQTTALFLLKHQVDFGMVRVGGNRCSTGAVPRVLKGAETATIALPAVRTRTTTATPTRALPVRPGTDTLYAIAVTNSRAALAFSQHFKRLPQRCAAAAQAGLRGATLEAWLETLADLIETWADDVEMRALPLGDTA
ncbi:MAG: hypothetical protein AAFR09_06515 [Pseudomonadota bacterium]